MGDFGKAITLVVIIYGTGIALTCLGLGALIGHFL